MYFSVSRAALALLEQLLTAVVATFDGIATKNEQISEVINAFVVIIIAFGN